MQWWNSLCRTRTKRWWFLHLSLLTFHQKILRLNQLITDLQLQLKEKDKNLEVLNEVLSKRKIAETDVVNWNFCDTSLNWSGRTLQLIGLQLERKSPALKQIKNQKSKLQRKKRQRKRRQRKKKQKRQNQYRKKEKNLRARKNARKLRSRDQTARQIGCC